MAFILSEQHHSSHISTIINEKYFHKHKIPSDTSRRHLHHGHITVDERVNMCVGRG